MQMEIGNMRGRNGECEKYSRDAVLEEEIEYVL